jgi:hypothetical protein
VINSWIHLDMVIPVEMFLYVQSTLLILGNILVHSRAHLDTVTCTSSILAENHSTDAPFCQNDKVLPELSTLGVLSMLLWHVVTDLSQVYARTSLSATR